jgi:hypothetical protein
MKDNTVDFFGLPLDSRLSKLDWAESVILISLSKTGTWIGHLTHPRLEL